MEKIKRHGLATKDQVASQCEGQVRGSGAMDRVAMKLEQGLGARAVRRKSEALYKTKK
jgi:hypothetical protein